MSVLSKDAKQARIKYLIIAFLAGFTALIYELYSTKVVFFYFLENTHALAVAISSFLAGLAFSGLIFSKYANAHPKRCISIIAFMQVLIAVYAFFVLRNYHIIPIFIDSFHASGFSTTILFLIKLVIVWSFLFIPAFFLGGAFPLLAGLYQQNFKKRIADTGIVYFWDTLGSVAGSLLSGFYLIPVLGLDKALVVPIAINIIILLVLTVQAKYRYVSIGLIVIFSAFLIFEKPKIAEKKHVSVQNNIVAEKTKESEFPLLNLDLNQFPSELGTQSYLESLGGKVFLRGRFGDIIFSQSSPYGAITVGKFSDFLGLFVNYRAMCKSNRDAGEIELGILTADRVKGKGNVVNIGLGCGNTAHNLEKSENVKKLTILEINPVIKEVAGKFFSHYNGDVLNSEKVNFLLQDGAEFIRQTDEIFDAIVIDIEEPTIIHSSPLYTLDYFEIIQSKLTDEGIFALWSSNGKPIYAKIVYNTVKEVFPHVKIRSKRNGSLQFYASMQPLDIEDDEHILKFINQSESTAINTIANRELEKNYDIKRAFNLPSDHEDKFVIQAD